MRAESAACLPPLAINGPGGPQTIALDATRHERRPRACGVAAQTARDQRVKTLHDDFVALVEHQLGPQLEAARKERAVVRDITR